MGYRIIIVIGNKAIYLHTERRTINMLPNLHDVAIQARQKYRDEFSPNEFVLSDKFKDIFAESLRRAHQTIDYTKHTAIITTAGNLKMYIPNQWFAAAAYMVPFVQVFLKYKKIIDAFLLKEYDTAQERKDAVKLWKETNDNEPVNSFSISITNYLENQEKQIDSKELEDTVRLLTLFVSDYSWWYGNKTIDRTDAYVSPVLSLLGVVNVSQGYIADICYTFATAESDLVKAVAEMIDSNPASENTAPPVNSNYASCDKRLVGGINEIIYGAPGTGKSKYIDNEYAHNTITTRVVFHPEYTFFDFIGTYKPSPVYKQSNILLNTLDGDEFTFGEPLIDYRFIPGPFINCLVSAWMNPGQMHTLIIEEINRANAAAVFGEIFQLLDRNINGESEYSIEPPYDLKQYLMSFPEMHEHIKNGLRIPSNMNIVATMNSADQGVMPMDSAFKRRWAFKYVRISIEGAVHEGALLSYASREVKWGNLVKAINKKLMDLNYEEDRLIGPYFIKPEEVGKRQATDKLLLYLWDDVLRYNHEPFFNAQVHNFAELSDKFSTEDVFDLLLNQDYAVLLNAGSDNEEQNNVLPPDPETPASEEP